MATQAKRWPTNAEWARQDAIATARKGRQGILAQLDNINDVAMLRQMAKAIEAFNQIERKLSEVGPQAEREQ